MDYWYLNSLGLTLSMSVMFGDLDEVEALAELKRARLEVALNEVYK